MHGEKLAQTKESLRHALRFLREGDTLSLAAFSDEVRSIFEPTPVDPQFRRKVESALEEMQAGGMTALCGGLEKGIKNALAAKLENNLILLLSDGQANVGETDIEKVGQRSSQAHKKGLVVSTLGVGEDYNEALMAEIATQGGGRYYHVQSSTQIVHYLTGELGEAADLAARDVHIQIKLPKGAALVPLSAAYTAEISGDQAVVSIGDIPRDLEVEIPLRLTVFSKKAGSRESVEGAVHYQTPAGSLLSASLNRVTLRFVEPKAFQLREGVVMPVAERVAKQMRAAHVLEYSRAIARGAKEDLQQADRKRLKLRDYLGLLDEQVGEKMVSELDEDLYNLRAASPAAKNVMAQAFKAQRFMRDLDQK
jgi:Ca-activated chloride channel family protein